jgi:hypothetical protein
MVEAEHGIPGCRTGVKQGLSTIDDFDWMPVVYAINGVFDRDVMAAWN